MEKGILTRLTDTHNFAYVEPSAYKHNQQAKIIVDMALFMHSMTHGLNRNKELGN